VIRRENKFEKEILSIEDVDAVEENAIQVDDIKP